MSEKSAESLKMDALSCYFEVSEPTFSTKVCKVSVLLRTHYLTCFYTKNISWRCLRMLFEGIFWRISCTMVTYLMVLRVQWRT